MPKNILDFPELPHKPSNWDRVLTVLMSQKMIVLAVVLAFVVIFLATGSSDRPFDIFIGMSLFLFLGLPMLCLMIAGMLAVFAMFFIKVKEIHYYRLSFLLYLLFELLLLLLFLSEYF